MDLELLNTKFKVSKDPGLDTLDSRFSDIAGMVQEGNFSNAAVQAQKILQDEIYDIRIICYYLYGFFDEVGPGSLKDIFHILGKIFCENWEAVGPLKNRTNHSKNSLNWLLKKINKILESEEKRKGEKWQSWQDNTPPENVREALDTIQALGQDMEAVLEKQASTVVDRLAKVTAWLDSFYRLIYREPVNEKVIESNIEDSDELEIQEESPPIEIESKPAPQKVPFLKGEYDLANGSESYHLQLLLKKMGAFEQLLAENKTTGAALVATDINQIINNFDPQLYFPRFFSTFTRLFAMNTEQLLAFDGCRDTAAWKSVEKLYQIDMQSFLDMDNGFHFKDPDSFQGDGQNDSTESFEDGEPDYNDDGENY